MNLAVTIYWGRVVNFFVTLTIALVAAMHIDAWWSMYAIGIAIGIANPPMFKVRRSKESSRVHATE